MALRHAAVGTATAGLVTALTALVLSTLPALAHEGEVEGEGKDAIGEVDPDYPTKAILGDRSGPGASCVDGQAAYFPCRNVNLASYLPMSDIGGGRGSDVWGWTDPETERRYAIAGRDNGTAFVDVTNERRPVYLGNLPTSGTNNVIWRDIKVYDDHAFIVAEAREHGMQVFDLTQLRDVDRKAAPVTFEETAHYAGFGRAHNLAINEQSGVAFAVGAREDLEQCAGGPHMVDLSDPASPVFAGCWGAYRPTGRGPSPWTSRPSRPSGRPPRTAHRSSSSTAPPPAPRPPPATSSPGESSPSGLGGTSSASTSTGGRPGCSVCPGCRAR